MASCCGSGHRDFARIMFTVGGVVYSSQHLGMPFGSVASVHAWHRVGIAYLCVSSREQSECIVVLLVRLFLEGARPTVVVAGHVAFC